MFSTLTARVRFCCHAFISMLLAASTLLMTLTLSPASAASVAMSCCLDGSSTHCSSGMKVEAEPAPEPEPTCEHETKAEVDETHGEEDVDTIVAEPENDDSEQLSQDSFDNSTSDTSTSSLTAPCAIDCCSLVWSSFQRPNRDQLSIVATKAGTHHFITLSKPQSSSLLLFASERFDKTTPRGPPYAL